MSTQPLYNPSPTPQSPPLLSDEPIIFLGSTWKEDIENGSIVLAGGFWALQTVLALIETRGETRRPERRAQEKNGKIG